MQRTWLGLGCGLALAGCSSLLGLDDDAADDDGTRGASSGADTSSGGSTSGAAGSSGSTASGGGSSSSGAGSSSGGGSSGNSSSSSGSSSGGGATVASDPRQPLWPPLPVAPPAANYTLTADTVLDHTTQLMWERVPPPAAATRVAAHLRCADLTLASHDDWRLPTRIEQLSILDYTRTPLVNPMVFGTVPSAPSTTAFWTESHVLFGPTSDINYFYVDTSSGNVNMSINDTGGTFTNLSRCVRAGIGTQPATRFVVTTDTVYDASTQLTWWRADSASNVTYSAALLACGDSELGGATDWRLPTVSEQHSMVDELRSEPPLWDPMFAASTHTLFWSSTESGGDRMYVVSYANASTLERHTEGDTLAVRCVH